MVKHLSFVLTQNAINKEMINEQLKYLFRWTKLQGHFKILKKISLLKNIDSKNQQIKTEFPPTMIIAERYLLKQHATKSKKKSK